MCYSVATTKNGVNEHMRFCKRLTALTLILCIALTVPFIAAQAAYETLRTWAIGTEVRRMQQALKTLGYDVKVDGTYGPVSEAAVRSFQRKNNLNQDGIAGNQTLTLLYSLSGDAASGENGGSASPVYPSEGESVTPSARLELGSSGADVTALQNKLNSLGYNCGRNDGVFDTATRGAVKAYQKSVGLSQDGIAGTQTLTKLFSSSAQGTDSPSGDSASAGAAIVATGNSSPLRFRGTPSAADSRNIIGSLNNGQSVEVLDSSGLWSRLRVNGRVGYVMTRYLSFAGSSPLPEESESSGQPVTPSAGITATVRTSNGGSLRLRSSATTSGNNVLASIPNKATVQVHSVAGTWTQCSWQGRTGYAMTEFLSISQAQPDPESPNDPVIEEESGYTRILRPGDSGDDVRRLQARLKELGYTISLTSSYDSATVAAVRAFQTINGLKVDGIFGSASAAILTSSAAQGADSTPQSFGTLRMGDKDGADKAVSKLQKRLADLGYSLTVDGSFGIKTHDAVVSFQQQNSINQSGIADAQTQARIYADDAKKNTGSTQGVDISAGQIGGPSTGSVKLLHWYKEVKPALGGGPTVRIYHPATGVSFNVKIYSLGRHADAEPKTLKDTQLMNAAFGPASWNTRPVYVKLPSGTWTLGTMHNYPHLSGSISDNGFGGHLCIHFLRDLDETQKADPNYGMQNQKAIRKAWKSMTGEDVQ